jgi:DNA polymerase-3 subunit delta
MLYVFHGPDRFSAREELDAIRHELDRDGNLGHNTTWLEARGLALGDLLAACHTHSFFAEPRLVIIEGLLGRFSGAQRRGRRAGRVREGAPASEAEQFLEALANLPETTTVVLLEETPPKALLDALPEGAIIREFRLKKAGEVRSWAALRVKASGASIAPAALNRLAELIDGANLGQLAQEIDKLATYANGRQIDVADVDALVSAALAYKYYDLTDAVIAGRADRALKVIQGMDDREQPPELLLFMLTRQYRQLLLAQALLREGMSTPQIGARLGIAHPFALSKVIDQATRYPAARLEDSYRRLLRADVAIKTGALDAPVALDLLVTELAQNARAGRPATAGR